jgi:hypothetical protein
MDLIETAEDSTMKSSLMNLVATGLALGVFAACGQKDAVDPAPPPLAAPHATVTTAPRSTQEASAETLPGANAVRDSLAKKDYQAAVDELLALRGIATGPKYTEYLTLYGEVLDSLRTESQSNRRAAEALTALQAVDRER